MLAPCHLDVCCPLQPPALVNLSELPVPNVRPLPLTGDPLFSLYTPDVRVSKHPLCQLPDALMYVIFMAYVLDWAAMHSLR